MARPIRELEVAPWARSEVESSERLVEIDRALAQDPGDADLWMERGLELAKRSYYREAVDAYSKAIALRPFCGIYYRHRGHRLLSCWRFEEACADFSMASRLIPENWDVWYHYGLSCFLLGDYPRAKKAYEACYALSETQDKQVAVTDWLWITLNRLGEKDAARAYLDRITPEFDFGENGSYFRRLMMYKGLVSPEELLPTKARELKVPVITMGFGLSNYYDVMGDRRRSDEVLDMVLEAGEKDLYFAFGYLAAMVDKRNRTAEASGS